MKRILTSTALSFALASTAWAGFINHKTDWDSMPPLQKIGYVQGVFDEQTMLLTSDDEEVIRLKKHRSACVANMGMTPQGLIELIDTTYRNDVSIWRFPPNIALIAGLYKMCGEP